MKRKEFIFSNEISNRDCKKALKSQKKYIRKFGDDRNVDYKICLEDNEVLSPVFGVKNIRLCENESSDLNTISKPVIIGNIRMGFGHYRISMAMASAAHALGYTPLWMDLNSFTGTTCTKVISSQNDLYSLGSRLSQKIPLFNKLVWEPMNYEGFKKLSYNVKDQKNSELLATVFKNIPKDIPVIGTHVWPAQAAVHAGMKTVINAIPDNWPMALHLSQGALHTVQTYNTYYGYRTLNGFDKKRILNPMEKEDILYTGHYIDDEIVKNIESDCEKRIRRIKDAKALRFLLTIGGAGAQGDFFAKIISTLLPYVKEHKACIYINCGDYENVWNLLKSKIPELNNEELCKCHFNNWQEEVDFANEAINADDKESSKGIHVFCNKDIFSAVYITNLLMRSCDLLVTKPSELAFYPVPKLFIRRVGGHEMWGAIHAVEIGDACPECESPETACAMVELFMKNQQLIIEMCNNIVKNNKNEVYHGAYKVIKAAMEKV